MFNKTVEEFNKKPTIYKVGKWGIGDIFYLKESKEGFKIESFPTRSMVFGVNINYKVGQAYSVKMPISMIQEDT